MRKYKLQWYRWRMKRLRKALRETQFMTEKPTLKSSRRRSKLEQAYQKVSMKWWDTRQPAMFDGAPFGKDITHEDYSMNDVREAMSGQNPFQSQEDTWEYRSIRVLEDKSSKVEFKRDEHGDLHMYRNGERVSEYPVKGLGVRD